MKILLISLAFTFAGSIAQAGSTHCSSERLYYSYVRADMGMRPPPGMLIGNTTIVLDGKVLVREDIIAELGQHSLPPYQVDISKAPEHTVVLGRTGNPMQGSSTVKTIAFLNKIDRLNLGQKELVLSEAVVCKTKWVMAP